ncbi:MAG: response regulator [Deltaproteobacteria bacterium]|nr:MAG: response regulator [Deltaproteobacteria bacterium]
MPAPANMKILLLEDMDSIRQQMVSDLRALGFSGEIHEAPDLKTAVSFCKDKEFQFIISDWNLPDGTGFDFLVKIKKVAKLAKLPFLMCTTMDEVENMIKAIHEGANEYVVKPWQKEELGQKINFAWDAVNGS